MLNNNHHLIQFIIMTIIGFMFNPMNLLAYRLSDLYLSLTLFYGGLVMASNMVWGHQLVNYFTMNKFNKEMFFIGIGLTALFTILLLRNQLLVDDNQWLRRMISHHSTALTTSHKIFGKTDNINVKNLAYDIIETQEKEITLMKQLL